MKLLMNSRIRSQLMETWQVLQGAGVDQQKLKVRSESPRLPYRVPNIITLRRKLSC